MRVLSEVGVLLPSQMQMTPLEEPSEFVKFFGFEVRRFPQLANGRIGFLESGKGAP